jgi:hypothetical protein
MLSALIQRSVEYVGVRQVVPAIGETQRYKFAQPATRRNALLTVQRAEIRKNRNARV